MRKAIMCFVALLAIAAAATGPARAQIYGTNIDLSNGESGTLSSDMTCTYLILYNQGTLTVNQGVTLTLNCDEFNLKSNSAIHLHGTMTGSVGDEPDWNNNSYINVYLSDGAKYTVTGLECNDGDGYLRYYGYDAATDGHGTVSVTNGPAAVTANSIGYETTTYTFTATPASGYHFVSWTKGAGGEELGTDASIDVTCEQNGQYQVYANFEEDVPAGPQLYTVTFAEGTEDVGNWSITPAEAATNTGVTEGTVVTVKYNGTSRINSIELKSKMLTTPLTMEAITAGTVKVYSPKEGMQYSLNGGAKTALSGTTTITVAAGDKVAFYGNGTNITTYQGTVIAGGSANVKVYGNIMSLVNEEHFDTATTLTVVRAFYGLFRENDKLSDASGLLLPATTLTERCYMSMFERCVNLTTAPAKLPATTLAINCYAYMFKRCVILTTAPELPAPVLAPSCYYNMFSDCRKLNSVTCLAIDISASSCTSNWLDGAGTVVEGTKTFNAASPVNWPTNSNSGIPSGWTLVTPAHTPLTLEALTDGTVKVQSPKSGMKYTLNGGAKTPVTSAAIEVVAGDKVAFYGNGTSITSYDGTTIAGGTADVKVYGNIMSLVDEENFATATTLSVEYQFYNLFSENNHLKDASGLLLPATTLAPTCYAYMFHYCSSLTAAPAVLPATTLAEACYRGMFQDCMSLTTAPELPAQTLVSYCYAHMFQLCTKLNSVTCLATSGINQNGSTESWLDNAGTDQSVTTKTFNAASTAEWPTSVHGIPEGWTLGAQSTPEPVTLVPTGNTNEWTFTMPADNMLLMLNYAPAHTVRFADGNNGWQVQDVTAATSAVAPAVLQNVIAGDSLVVTAPATLPGKVKSVKAVKYVPPVVITWNSTNVFNSDHENDRLMNNEWDSNPLTYEGVTISISGEEVSSFKAYNVHDQAGVLTCFGDNGDSFTFTAPAGKKFCKIEIIDDWSITFTNYGDWTQTADNKVVWSGTAANAVTLGTVYTTAHYLNSIVFTLIDAQ